MICKAPETPNQIALLRALTVKSGVNGHARLVSTGLSGPPISVILPGVPKPIHYTTKQTLRACIKRGWLTGNDKDGYAINGYGILALGCVP